MRHHCIVIFFSAVLAGSLLATEQQQKFTHIQLNPSIIGLLDGKSYAISGEMIGAMYKIIRDIQELLLGMRMKSGERQGKYIYKNIRHCVRSLVPIEIEMKEKLATLKNKNNPLLSDEIKILENDLAELKKLQACMNADFKKIADPFVGDAKSSKDLFVILIEEECEKRNKPQSRLLGWTQMDMDELDTLDRDINTIVLFNDFCTDLITFMSDIIYNCKKGRAQFEKLVEKYVQSQKQYL